MGPVPYVLDPLDPRAPTQEQWDAMTDAERRRVVASLPSDIPRAQPPEGDRHFVPKVQAREALGDWFRRRGRDVYLGSELPVYYPGERMFAPDLIAVLDVELRPRDSWVVSAEGRGLDFALEIHVAGDRKKDVEENVERLARLGVPEYFVFEPLRQRILGFRLPASRPASYVPIVPQAGRWSSRVLGLELGLDEGQLRFYAGAAPLPHSVELIAQLSKMVDDSVARAEAEARRAEEEARRAEEEARRAEEEARRAAETSERLARLEAKLRELGVDPDSVE